LLSHAHFLQQFVDDAQYILLRITVIFQEHISLSDIFFVCVTFTLRLIFRFTHLFGVTFFRVSHLVIHTFMLGK
jgi:hypothetical protein